jgi:hypothetical protein
VISDVIMLVNQSAKKNSTNLSPHKIGKRDLSHPSIFDLLSYDVWSRLNLFTNQFFHSSAAGQGRYKIASDWNHRNIYGSDSLTFYFAL